MLTIIVVCLVIFILILIFFNKKEGKQDVSASVFVNETKKRIEESKKLLKNIEDERKNHAIQYENSEEFEVTGVHVSNRKKYILDFCTEYDEVSLIHEKNNSFSDKAIAIKHKGKLIGYISRFDSDDVHKIILKPLKTFICEIDFDGSYLSVSIIIEY